MQEGPLQGLHDIVAPEPVSWMPGTVGWVVLALVALALVLLGVRAAVRRHRARRYRREALDRLGRLHGWLDDPDRRLEALRALPALVKRTALVAAPRAEVASLSGRGWLEFLDASWKRGVFTEGPGRVLPVLAYGTDAAAASVDPGQARDLVDAIRGWIRGHRVRV